MKYRLPMFLAQTDETDAQRGPALLDVPVIPANDLRGRLHWLAARMVFDALLARGEQISLNAYRGMTCGAVTGSPGGRLTFRNPFR